MNIFKILSSNDGSINEPNISSFLAYLLDPNEDHGISSSLLSAIISDFKEVGNEQNEHFFPSVGTNDLSSFYIDVNPEYRVLLDNRRSRDIDILIELYSNQKATEPLYAICIENKIRDNSIIVNDNQLREELEGIRNYYADNDFKTDVYFCFITLGDSTRANNAFESFEYDKKLHLHWKGDFSIQKKLRDILDQERLGEIDPISEDSCFLIKSFISFINSNFKSYVEEESDKQERIRYGNKTIMGYIREVANTHKDGEDLVLTEIKREVSEKIKEESGLDINKNTLNCQMYIAIVNEKNRRHFNVTNKNCQNKNLFYYPNENNRSIIRKYTGIEKVNVYTVDDNLKVSESANGDESHS